MDLTQSVTFVVSPKVFPLWLPSVTRAQPSSHCLLRRGLSAVLISLSPISMPLGRGRTVHPSSQSSISSVAHLQVHQGGWAAAGGHRRTQKGNLQSFSPTAAFSVPSLWQVLLGWLSVAFVLIFYSVPAF